MTMFCHDFTYRFLKYIKIDTKLHNHASPTKYASERATHELETRCSLL